MSIRLCATTNFRLCDNRSMRSRKRLTGIVDLLGLPATSAFGKTPDPANGGDGGAKLSVAPAERVDIDLRLFLPDP